LREVLADADGALRHGQSAGARVWPTGFPMLDTYLTGGVRAGELVLLGGPQGMGKTTFVLQLLRNVVAAGGAGVYFSYEHDSSTLLERLLAIEAGEEFGLEGISLRRIREILEGAAGAAGTAGTEGGAGSLSDRLATAPGGAAAMKALTAYSDRMLLHRSSGSGTDVGEIRAVVEQVRERTGMPPVVVVDYLQKVAVPALDVAGEEERVTVVVEGLKDLALDAGIPVLAVVAAEKEGLTAGKRLRVQHLRGSSALAYEPDIVLILNEKYDVVARHHLVFDVGNAERFRSWAVLSIEKNRSGLDNIDLEFRKRFEQSRFEPEGQPVSEQLVDERVYVE
jgi:replicative DNA helicase